MTRLFCQDMPVSFEPTEADIAAAKTRDERIRASQERFATSAPAATPRDRAPVTECDDAPVSL